MDTEVQLIDCTLRDGGYYNNWNFSKSFIQKYLNILSKTEITNIEIGFFNNTIIDYKFTFTPKPNTSLI